MRYSGFTNQEENIQKSKQMKKTDQVRLRNGQIINRRKTQRNDPCPCGSRQIIVDQNKQEYNRPVKFKHCCLKSYR